MTAPYYVRPKPGPAAFGAKVLPGGIRTLRPPASVYARMPYPCSRSLLTWTGTQYGLYPAEGAPCTSAQVTVTHRVSDPAAFSSVTAQLHAGGEPVGDPAALTLSMPFVTETVTVPRGNGITPGNIASLELRITWQQVTIGIAYVSWSLARTPVEVPPPPGLLLSGIV